MPKGKQTSAEKEAEFRAHYLLSANASESAREVGLPVSTGRDIAKRLQLDEGFAQDRRALRAQYLDELVCMRQDIARTARDRAKRDRADEYPTGEGVTVIDKRPEWAKVVLDAEKNAHNLAKIEQCQGGSEGNKPAEVHITVTGPDGPAA